MSRPVSPQHDAADAVTGHPGVGAWQAHPGRHREGDTLVVPSLDRLGRSVQDLIAIVSGLRKRDVGCTSLHEAAARGGCTGRLHEALDGTTPGGRLVFHVFAALAEFVRELIVQGTNAGLDAARARGSPLSHRPAVVSPAPPKALGRARPVPTTACRFPPHETVVEISRNNLCSTSPGRVCMGLHGSSSVFMGLRGAKDSRRTVRGFPARGVPAGGPG
ncbi:recombinase family protein [Streptomyces sp. NPDC015125]|uniref:recombinase family protein n=1 Tax=Streptomyces sp. NPDC015125 TaxID=3364938 RepID=UPI0036F626C5